ncbi:MAG: hypothetical protein FJZ97_01325 [Chloroflexi bacterium]|nr:hypothetical protein [Chloroflexota bacterium]
MSEWNRSTRELPLEALAPDLLAALQAHIDQFNLGPILKDAQQCIETTSVKKKGRTRVVVTAVLTPRWLAWVIQDDKDELAALSVPLDQATVTDYASTPGYRILPDEGVIVERMFTGMVGTRGSARTSYTFTLGG